MVKIYFREYKEYTRSSQKNKLKVRYFHNIGRLATDKMLVKKKADSAEKNFRRIASTIPMIDWGKRQLKKMYDMIIIGRI